MREEIAGRVSAYHIKREKEAYVAWFSGRKTMEITVEEIRGMKNVLSGGNVIVKT
jgi:hypothetical protein